MFIESTLCPCNIYYLDSILVSCSAGSNLNIMALMIWDLEGEKSTKVVKIELAIMMKISRESRFQDGGKV